jgi:hypothetical protein
MMFIKAIEDPKTVIIPISQEANPKYFVMPRILLIRSSYYSKLLSRTGLNFRTLRMVITAWSMASSNSSFRNHDAHRVINVWRRKDRATCIGINTLKSCLLPKWSLSLLGYLSL